MDGKNDGLRPWLMEMLAPLCEADPETLADYVLSLLKNDVAKDQRRAELCEALQDFLDAHTEVRLPPLPPPRCPLCVRPARVPAASARRLWGQFRCEGPAGSWVTRVACAPVLHTVPVQPPPPGPLAASRR